MKTCKPLWKPVRHFVRMLGIVLPHDPAIPLLDIHPEDDASYHRDTC